MKNEHFFFSFFEVPVHKVLWDASDITGLSGKPADSDYLYSVEVLPYLIGTVFKGGPIIQQEYIGPSNILPLGI